MRNKLMTALLIAFAASANAFPGGEAPDYSKEPAVIQKLATQVRFTADGAREWHQQLSVRIQSEAALREFGVLAFSYGSQNEHMAIEYVRVRKVDGSVIDTPASNVMDTASQVQTVAPMYTDIKQKQVPVKALSIGDVLEYSVSSITTEPEIPGQFWYSESFSKDAVILSQTLQISVPGSKYVQIYSPKLNAEVHDEGAIRVYLWKYAQLAPSKPEDKKLTAAEREGPKVELTTFKNWEEVGSWWSRLSAPELETTPPIQAKARELTAGLATKAEKEEAIYKYVAMRFRYISISLGAGRYRPHGAKDVLANQYGDCKDKHTLLAALLKAAGIEAWPALIGSGIKFESNVPSPEQFNHVITVVPQDGKYIWLDTTAEVAPLGLLHQSIRDKQALVIPQGGKAFLAKTPMNPPAESSQTLNITASLAADGTLTGHFDFTLSGDAALAMRAGFHELAPSEWQTLAQQVSYALQYAGEVSAVSVDNLEEIEKPFHYSYDYTRKNYSAWEQHQITTPLPPLQFGPGDEADKPEEAFWAGAPGKLVYHAELKLPNGYVLEAPQNASATSDFAEYAAIYSLRDGVLKADRTLTIKKAKVPLDEWTEYKQFSKSLRTDQTTLMSLTQGATAASSGANAEADRLLMQATAAIQAHNLDEARNLLNQAELLNPKQPKLWGIYGTLEMSSGKFEEALSDGRKEIANHPNEIEAYQFVSYLLTHLKRTDEVVELWRSAVVANPKDRKSIGELAAVLYGQKRYDEIPPVLEEAIAEQPNDYPLRVIRLGAWLYSGKNEYGIPEAQQLAGEVTDPRLLNDIAYGLADNNDALDLALGCARKSVTATEQATKTFTLSNVGVGDLAKVSLLGASWDTLGWIYYKKGDLKQAEGYLKAAWQLRQCADCADHLGHVYLKAGKREEAIHLWRLALGANPQQADAAQQLHDLGADVTPHTTSRLRGNSVRIAFVPASEELGKIRTMGIDGLPKQTGSAEFFILASKSGIEKAAFISGTEKLATAGSAIQGTTYDFAIPDDGTRLIRRGILSCSEFTSPSCSFTLLLPESTRAASVRTTQMPAQPAHSGS